MYDSHNNLINTRNFYYYGRKIFEVKAACGSSCGSSFRYSFQAFGTIVDPLKKKEFSRLNLNVRGVF